MMSTGIAERVSTQAHCGKSKASLTLSVGGQLEIDCKLPAILSVHCSGWEVGSNSNRNAFLTSQSLRRSPRRFSTLAFQEIFPRPIEASPIARIPRGRAAPLHPKHKTIGSRNVVYWSHKSHYSPKARRVRENPQLLRNQIHDFQYWQSLHEPATRCEFRLITNDDRASQQRVVGVENIIPRIQL